MTYFYAIGRAVNGSADNKFGIAGKGFASKELAQEKLDAIIAYQAENGEVLMTNPALVEITVEHKSETAAKETRGITPKVAKAYNALFGAIEEATEAAEATEDAESEDAVEAAEPESK